MMDKIIQKLTLTAVLALTISGVKAQQYYSSLDSTFGINGIAYQNSFYTYHDMSNAIDVALQTDGKMLCAYNDMCHTFIMRMNADGTLDNTFLPSTGYEVFPVPTPGVVMLSGNVATKGEALVRQTSSGKIIFAYSGYGMTRLKSTGGLDSSFGNLTYAPGFMDLNLNNTTHPLHAVHDLYESQSGYYFASTITPQYTNVDTLVIVKTTLNGIVDNSYGTNGVRIITLDSTNFGFQNHAHKVRFTSDGKILVIGQGKRSAFPANNEDAFVAKFNLDGTPVTSFGVNGVRFLDLNNMSDRAIVVTTNTYGDIFIGGVSYDKMFIAKLFANGTVDMSFGTNGAALYTPNSNCMGGSMTPFSIAATSGSKVFMINFYNPAINVFYDEYISFNANGTPNTDFGPNGVINNNTRERATSLLTTPDNKILVTAADTHARLLRFKGDPNALAVANAAKEPFKAWAANGKAFIQLPANANNFTADLYSSDGKRVSQFGASDFGAAGNTRSITLPADMPHGIYVFSVHYNSQVQQVKFNY